MNRYRRSRETKTCGTKYAYFLYYVTFLSNLTILIWNPDTIPFTLASLGLRIPFGIYKAIKTANDEDMSKNLRFLIMYSASLGLLGIAMNYFGFINPCAQYVTANDPCKNTNIFIDYTKTNVTCDTFGNNQINGETEISTECRRAFSLRTATLLFVATILFLLSVAGLYARIALDVRERERADDGTDNIQEKMDLKEFLWSNNRIFPQHLLLRA